MRTLGVVLVLLAAAALARAAAGAAGWAATPWFVVCELAWALCFLGAKLALHHQLRR